MRPERPTRYGAVGSRCGAVSVVENESQGVVPTVSGRGRVTGGVARGTKAGSGGGRITLSGPGKEGVTRGSGCATGRPRLWA